MDTQTVKRDSPERVIARIAGTIGALGLIVGTTITVFSYTVPHPSQTIAKAVAVSLNLIVLIVYCLRSTRVPRLELKEGAAAGEYCELLNVESPGETPDAPGMAARKANRVNRLVEQLHNNIIAYAVSLIAVYLLYLFDNQWLFDELLFPERHYHQYISVGIKAAIGVFNYLSAVFLYLGFIVLYDKTIEPDDVTPRPYRRKTLIVSMGFLLIYIIFSVAFVTNSVVGANPERSIYNTRKLINDYDTDTSANAKTQLNEIKAITNMKLSDQESMGKIGQASDSYRKANKASAAGSTEKIDEEIASYKNRLSQVIFNLLYLFIGICNGLAMILLFGRYVSMEHSIFSMDEGEYEARKYSKLLHFFTIYILPLYALAQPLFGSFEIDAFGPRRIFAIGVFIVCWIGKIGFLYLTYIFMKERWMHLWLHTGVNYRGIPKSLVGCFKFDS